MLKKEIYKSNDGSWRVRIYLDDKLIAVSMSLPKEEADIFYNSIVAKNGT